MPRVLPFEFHPCDGCVLEEVANDPPKGQPWRGAAMKHRWIEAIERFRGGETLPPHDDYEQRLANAADLCVRQCTLKPGMEISHD